MLNSLHIENPFLVLEEQVRSIDTILHQPITTSIVPTLETQILAIGTYEIILITREIDGAIEICDDWRVENGVIPID